MATAQELSQQIADSIVSQIPIKSDFTTILPWENYWDQNLANASIAQQTDKYFMPQIEEGIGGIRTEAASRGLFRSGVRKKQETKFLEDTAEREALMKEQLFGTREAEQMGRYGLEQERYEASPISYQAPAAETLSSFLYETPATQQVQQIQYGLGSSEDVSNRFGDAYKQWYTQRYGAR